MSVSISTISEKDMDILYNRGKTTKFTAEQTDTSASPPSSPVLTKNIIQLVSGRRQGVHSKNDAKSQRRSEKRVSSNMPAFANGEIKEEISKFIPIKVVAVKPDPSSPISSSPISSSPISTFTSSSITSTTAKEEPRSKFTSQGREYPNIVTLNVTPISVEPEKNVSPVIEQRKSSGKRPITTSPTGERLVSSNPVTHSQFVLDVKQDVKEPKNQQTKAKNVEFVVDAIPKSPPADRRSPDSREIKIDKGKIEEGKIDKGKIDKGNKGVALKAKSDDRDERIRNADDRLSNRRDTSSRRREREGKGREREEKEPLNSTRRPIAKPKPVKNAKIPDAIKSANKKVVDHKVVDHKIRKDEKIRKDDKIRKDEKKMPSTPGSKPIPAKSINRSNDKPKHTSDKIKHTSDKSKHASNKSGYKASLATSPTDAIRPRSPHRDKDRKSVGIKIAGKSFTKDEIDRLNESSSGASNHPSITENQYRYDEEIEDEDNSNDGNEDEENENDGSNDDEENDDDAGDNNATDNNSADEDSSKSSVHSSRTQILSRKDAIDKKIEETFPNGFYPEDDAHLREAIRIGLQESKKKSVQEALDQGLELNARILTSMTRPDAISEVIEGLVSQRREAIAASKRRGKENSGRKLVSPGRKPAQEKKQKPAQEKKQVQEKKQKSGDEKKPTSIKKQASAKKSVEKKLTEKKLVEKKSVEKKLAVSKSDEEPVIEIVDEFETFAPPLKTQATYQEVPIAKTSLPETSLPKTSLHKTSLPEPSLPETSLPKISEEIPVTPAPMPVILPDPVFQNPETIETAKPKIKMTIEQQLPGNPLLIPVITPPKMIPVLVPRQIKKKKLIVEEEKPIVEEVDEDEDEEIEDEKIEEEIEDEEPITEEIEEVEEEVEEVKPKRKHKKKVRIAKPAVAVEEDDDEEEDAEDEENVRLPNARRLKTDKERARERKGGKKEDGNGPADKQRDPDLDFVTDGLYRTEAERAREDYVYDPLEAQREDPEDVISGDDEFIESSEDDEKKLTIGEKKDEMLYRFKLVREGYPNIALPRITKRMKLAKMVRYYGHVMDRIKLKVKTSNFKIFLIGGFLIMQFLGGKIGLDMSGFTVNQMYSMKHYDRLLRELGESDWTGIGVDMPIYFRLPFFMAVNAGIFVIAKIIHKKTKIDYTSQFQKLYAQLIGGGDDFQSIDDKGGSKGLDTGTDEEGGGGGLFGMVKSFLGMMGGGSGGGLFGGGDSKDDKPKRGETAGPSYKRRSKKQ